MSDLPEQGLFQQLNAKPVSGEHLEVLGKTAAALWGSGKVDTLTQAVVATVKHAGLSPEQVKRVVEFANTDAYLTEFKKEGAHKVVSFTGGPADPSEILKDLNDGGGGSVFDRGTRDYQSPPRNVKTASKASSMEKTAAVEEPEKDALDEFFSKISKVDYPEENPYGDAIRLRDKLAGEFDLLNDQLSGLETAYADLADRVYYGVKQAALSGSTLGEVVQVWSTVVPSSDHVKIAFQLFTPRLIREGVFGSHQDLLTSTEKTGQARLVNPRHPMVSDYREFCEVLSKLAELRVQKDEVRDCLGELTTFLQKEASGLVSRVTGAAAKASKPAGEAVHGVAKALAGDGDLAKGLGAAAEKVTKYSPHLAALVGGNEVRRHLKYSPSWNKFQSLANPSSDQYRQREYDIASRGGYSG